MNAQVSKTVGKKASFRDLFRWEEFDKLFSEGHNNCCRLAIQQLL
jgi:hypothetical protein